MTLKPILDKARPATRKDVVRSVDAIESTLPSEGEYPGRADLAEIEAAGPRRSGGRATTPLGDTIAAVGERPTHCSRLSRLWKTCCRSPAGPPRCSRSTRRAPTRGSATCVLTAAGDARCRTLPRPNKTAVHADAAAPMAERPPTHAQQVQNAIDRIKLLLGKDFPGSCLASASRTLRHGSSTRRLRIKRP